MQATDITKLIQSGKIDDLQAAMASYKINIRHDIPDHLTNHGEVSTHLRDHKQYCQHHHEIFNTRVRQDKTVYTENEAGQKEIQRTIPVARLSVPDQKRIVQMAASFIGVPKIISNPANDNEDAMIEALERVHDQNKIDYKFRDLLKKLLSERECAELWYNEKLETGADYWQGTTMTSSGFGLRMRILSPSMGDTLLPVFDETGDMIAFGRKYCVKQLDGPDVVSFDLYTKEYFYFFQKATGDSEWSMRKGKENIFEKIASIFSTGGTAGIKNPFNKIPVIYYSQPTTEWSDVQQLIERYETLLSNHADTNDYFSSPIVVAKGNVKGFGDKGEEGKVLEVDGEGSVEYLTWNNLPESKKLEFENLRDLINTHTNTPNISFDNVKGIGQLSGIALKLFFMDAHMKADDKLEILGSGVQRRLNFLKSAIAILNASMKPVVNITVKPKFTFFLPKDVDGEVSTLVKAVGAGILSKETAVKLNPLVEDADNELTLIKEEAAAAPPPVPPVPPTA